MLYMLSNTKVTFMKKLSNTDAELKKRVAYKKKRVHTHLIDVVDLDSIEIFCCFISFPRIIPPCFPFQFGNFV